MGYFEELENLSDQEKKEMIRKKGKLRVFYGITKINKVLKKPSIAVFFENERYNSEKNERMVSRWIKIVHTRLQTEEEKEDSIFGNRVFTKYELCFNEKPFFGNYIYALEINHQADQFHVSKEERDVIKNKLLSELKKTYKLKNEFQGIINFE